MTAVPPSAPTSSSTGVLGSDTDSLPPALTDPVLEGLPGLRHGFFTRHGGVSTGPYASLNVALASRDDPAAVAANRARIRRAMGADHLVSAHQVHGIEVVPVTDPWGDDGPRPRGDGLVTDRPGLALGIVTADCGPVLFADREAGVVGACHAGWKGAIAGITDSTLEAMQRLGARLNRIVAAIGPMIGQASYEVGSEFEARFLAADPANARFFRPGTRDGHPLFDLKGYLQARLTARGLAAVSVSPRDTCAEADDFFSYRRATLRAEPAYGHGLSAICLSSDRP